MWRKYCDCCQAKLKPIKDKEFNCVTHKNVLIDLSVNFEHMKGRSEGVQYAVCPKCWKAADGKRLINDMLKMLVMPFGMPGENE
jgi:hypothetical protein